MTFRWPLVGLAFFVANAAAAFELHPGTPIPMGGPQFRVAIADINRDGIPDLIAATVTALTTRLGVGAAHVVPGPDVTTTGNFDFHQVADFNGDGNPDILARGRLFLGNGNGTFSALAAPIATVAGDFTGDGCLDVAASQSFEQNVNGLILVFPGHCDGTFGAAVITNTGFPGFIYELQAADFNGDGRADLAVAFQQTVLVYNGQADGHVGPLRGTGIFLPNFSDLAGGAHLAVGDLNGDGKPDIVAGSLFLSSLGVAFASGDLFVPGSAPAPPGMTLGLATGDVDGDGRSDVAFVGCLMVCNPINALLLYAGTPTGLSSAQAFTTPVQPSNVAIGDLDGDGRPDIVVTTRGTDILLFLNGPLAPPTPPIAVPTTSVPVLLGIAVALLILGVRRASKVPPNA